MATNAKTSWTTRAKVRKATPSGTVTAEYVAGGEVVRVSPRYSKHGTNFRVTPERPAVYFANWAAENGMMPAITAEEAESEQGRQILAPLFEKCQQYFQGIEPAVLGGEAEAKPDLTNGFTFLVQQVTVERIGFATTGGTAAVQPTVSADTVQEMAKRIEEMRAKHQAKDAPAATPAKEPKAKKS
jgi:hypothetical protein